MENRTINTHQFPWGRLIDQPSLGDRYQSESDNSCDQQRTIFVLGRPVVRQNGPDPINESESIAQWAIRALDSKLLKEGAADLNRSLSGMYSIIELSGDRVSVLTDHLGFRPIYIAKNNQGHILGIGSHVESLSAALGLDHDLDIVSLGELFSHNYITFPFTTRHSIKELDPCSINTIELDVPPSLPSKLDTKVLWEPTEPSCFPDQHTIRKELKQALLQAGDDLTSGCDQAAILLSGGVDSRAVLSVIPKERIAHALTYVTNENNETDIAQQVAQSHGIEHRFVQRDRDYFPNLVNRGLKLFGMELRGNCHGLCITDANIQDQYDVVIGGQLSDTLLKAHFMPMHKRARYQPITLKSKLRKLIKGPPPIPVPSINHTTGRDPLINELTPEIRDQVRERHQRRMEEVKRVRPTTADEWHRFWPCSRQDDSSHTLGNARLMCSDTLFAHQSIVEVSTRFDPKFRIGGELTDQVFAEFAGDLMRLPNANTGLPANANAKAVHRKRKNDRKAKARAINNGETESQDWNQVQTSWAHPVLMQTQSKVWEDLRAMLIDSSSLATLSKIIDRGGPAMISVYQDDLPSTSNHIAMQLAIWLDTLAQRSMSNSNENEQSEVNS